MRTKSVFILSLFLLLFGCALQKTSTENQAAIYQKAISTAMSPDSSKICYNLIPITKENDKLVWKRINGEDYLLVVTWKQNVSYYKPYLDSAFYNTGAYPIWVTTVPELAERIKKESPVDVDLRLKQLLGLPPTSVYSYFVEFWVRPSDMFRPCPDKEIKDSSCSLCFPDGTDSTHINWINTNRIDRYYPCNLYDKYPWTQLGYTYDWNPGNQSHIGLSEFVIGSRKKIVVKSITTTSEYLKKENYRE